jgi:hypothetical protein
VLEASHRGHRARAGTSVRFTLPSR